MWQVEMVNRLKKARPQERKQIIAKYQEKTGYSKQYLYEIARKYGFNTDRKKRIDKGRFALTEEQLAFVASLVYGTAREVKGPIMPVEAAIEIAIDNGIIERDAISLPRIYQLLREREINKAAFKIDKPYTPMRSLHPNHVHVFDVSVCIQYYLRGKKGLAIMDERDFYKNKPQNFEKIKTRLLRYAIVDHFSGAFYLRYYDTTGETQDNLYDFLIRAWSHKNDERYPFRGVPYILLMDTGAANSSQAIVSFLKRLECEIPDGMPYNPQRQGAVEVLHNIVEMWFESKLRIQPANTIEDLNRWAYDFCVWFNATREHSRHRMVRTQCWLLIKPEQLRELPPREILQELYSYDDERNTRLVNRDYTISFSLNGTNNIYNVKHIEGIIPGKSKVLVRIKPYLFPVVDVIFNEKAYECRPVPVLPAHLGGFRSDAAVIGQEYKSQPEALTQQAIKRFENMAYGEEKKKDAIPFEGLTVHGIYADKVGNISYIEKKGTPIEVDKAIAVKEISFTEFLKRLIQQVGPISKELNQSLRSQYGESIKISKAEEVIRQIAEGQITGQEVKKAKVM